MEIFIWKFLIPYAGIGLIDLLRGRTGDKLKQNLLIVNPTIAVFCGLVSIFILDA